ncbi:hypothetical protein Tco_0740893 [Tanacetum coccineum]
MLVLDEVDDEVVFGSVCCDDESSSVFEGKGNVGKLIISVKMGGDVVKGFGEMLANGNSVSSNKTCLLVMVLCVSGTVVVYKGSKAYHSKVIKGCWLVMKHFIG